MDYIILILLLIQVLVRVVSFDATMVSAYLPVGDATPAQIATMARMNQETAFHLEINVEVDSSSASYQSNVFQWVGDVTVMSIAGELINLVKIHRMKIH
uniref:Putative secreted protein n=1 Tax=Xenopsylla cheopis TaxID=163159 RepID=A0A6M2DXL6_XENCH